jgi:hypothetical protein
VSRGPCEDELLHEAKQLRDEELLAHLQRLLRDDRALTAQLIVHIGEVDARGLYREHAYASMFEYAFKALHMSESEAYTRIRAARLSREFPVVLGMLAKGELHLSAVKLLAPVLSAENCEELVRAARFTSKRQVELMLAQRFPRADVPNVICKLPAKVTTAVLTSAVPGALSLPPTAAPVNSISPPESKAASDPTPAPSLQLTSPPAPVIAPLRAERFKVQFTADQRLHDKLKQAQDLLRHQVPGWRPRRRARARARRADRRAAEAALCARAQAAHNDSSQTVPARVEAHPARGPARGHRARRPAMQLRQCRRQPLRATRIPRGSSRGARRPRWGGDGSEHPSALPRAQPAARRARLRPRVHAAAHLARMHSFRTRD